MPHSEELDSLMLGVPDMASARGHAGARTNKDSRMDYITEKPYLNHQQGMRREPILGY